MKSGAEGYILKNTPADRMASAIYELHEGGSPISPSIARKVIASFHETFVLLSKRELEVLEILAKGMLYKEAADQLFISTETIKKHVRNVYTKLHVSNKTEAVLTYLNERH